MVIGIVVDLSALPYLRTSLGRSRAQTSGEAEPSFRRQVRRSPPSDVGRGGASPQTSGEAEPTLGGQTRRSQPLGVSRGGANLWRSGKAEPVASVSTEAEPTLGGWTRWSPWPRWSDEAEPIKRCGHALDCSDESTLMVISSSSSGTLVLVPDNSP